jgi:uncharacterized protein YlzI (FlbEa/FlbD family)
MTNSMIEVTRVEMLPAGLASPRKKMLGSAHIVSIEPGPHGASYVTMSTGDKFNVKESYDELKAAMGALDA